MTTSHDTIPYRDTYGAKETNALSNGLAYHRDKTERQHPDHQHGVPWSHPGLKVTRLRLLSDPGHPVWDVSYCDGELDGYYVDVQLPFSDLPKRNVIGYIIECAKRDKVYARGLGILDNISKLV